MSLFSARAAWSLSYQYFKEAGQPTISVKYNKGMVVLLLGNIFT